MAYSFVVLVARKSLPDVAELGPILRKAKVPLAINETWSWKKDSGWLPMVWRKQDSGCEVEFVKLSKKEAAAAMKAGHTGFDAAVTITTRGSESLQAGVCFGAALAIAASGCISEEDGLYIGYDASMRWAKKTAREMDKQTALDEIREAARADAQESGDVEGKLKNALGRLAGSRVKRLVSMLDRLAVALKDGSSIHGSSWRLTAGDGTRYAQNRYSTIRTRQARLMTGTGGAKQRKELAVLEKQLLEAESLDAKELSLAIKEINTWPDDIRIKSVAWLPPNIITVSFDIGTSIEFVGGMFGEVTCSFPPLRYGITDEGPRLT